MPRWTFAMVGFGLAVLLGEAWLVQRALDAVDREAAARREQLIERCHAELGRGLAELLSREDARPFTHWRHLYVPDDAVPGLVTLAVSPLARLPEDPAIIGWIQYDPDGSVHTPLRPRDEELARLSAGWNDAALVAHNDERVNELMARLVSVEAMPEQHATVLQEDSHTSTYGYAQVDAYLNRKQVDASLSRSQGERVVATRSGNIASFIDPLADTRNAQVIQEAQQNQDPTQAMIACIPDGWVAGGVLAAEQTVVIGPFRASPARADSLLLLRDVAVAGGTWRQGVMLDRAAVQTRLARDLLDDAERPAGLAVHWDQEPGARAFAPPFTDLSARIDLPPAATNGQRRAVLGFGIAVLTATVGALLAAYLALNAALRDVRRRQDFVAAVTHELKTPLTAIRLHAEMLRDGLVADPLKQTAYHATIVAESGRLARLIGNVLDLARLERGERGLSPQWGDPTSVIDEAVAVIEPHARTLGFTIVVERAPETLSARFDRDALVQVVINLVDNALKFAAGAERTITLTVRQQGERVTVAIADRVPGVPEADLRRIFQPFWRGGRELTRRAPGTGIGLALVRSLMEGMGGSVHARNRPEGGLLVECVLPT